MRRRRRERRRLQGDVELNLAAMLDMAFQLLAFFILTFRPSPVEGQIALRMPAPQPISKPAEQQASGSNEADTISLQGVETLTITALSNADGGIQSLRIAQGEPTPNLQVFEERLNAIFADPAIPFQQVILEVGSGLRYEHVMQLLDICARVKLPSGERLSQLSFVELPEQPEGA